MVAPPANPGMPNWAMESPSILTMAWIHSSAALPASIIFLSMSCTGGVPNGMKNGPTIGPSTRSVKGSSMLHGPMAPITRGR